MKPETLTIEFSPDRRDMVEPMFDYTPATGNVAAVLTEGGIFVEGDILEMAVYFEKLATELWRLSVEAVAPAPKT
jgi:methylthioribose-1-phosphate isomerase